MTRGAVVQPGTWTTRANETTPTPLVHDGRVAGWLLDACDRRPCPTAGQPDTAAAPVLSGAGSCRGWDARSWRPDVEMIPTEVDRTSRPNGILRAPHGSSQHRHRDRKNDISCYRCGPYTSDGRIDCAAATAPAVHRRAERRSVTFAASRTISTFDTCIGACHKDGQPLTVSVGAPTMSIGVATVGA